MKNFRLKYERKVIYREGLPECEPVEIDDTLRSILLRDTDLEEKVIDSFFSNLLEGPNHIILQTPHTIFYVYTKKSVPA